MGWSSGFQCSSASRKFLNSVSFRAEINDLQLFQCSSASRKFLNRAFFPNSRSPRRNVSVLFSEPKIPQFTTIPVNLPGTSTLFQCSSASRKFLNRTEEARATRRTNQFQCSSASRKFLNLSSSQYGASATSRFSALQRAENSSICDIEMTTRKRYHVSVLFSEPKIPQFQCRQIGRGIGVCFSALQRAENSSIVFPTRY